MPNYVAGIPSCVLVGELALCEVLCGQLPWPAFPERLAELAPRLWRQQNSMTLHTAETHARRSDVVGVTANMGRAIIMEAQARFAERRTWVLNEKSIVEKAGLSRAAAVLLAAGPSAPELMSSVDLLRRTLEMT